MKKILTLSAALLAASAFAQPVTDHSTAVTKTPVVKTTARQLSPREAAQKIADMRGKVKYEDNFKAISTDPSLMKIDREPGVANAAAAEGTINAYYNIGDGVFYPGLEYTTHNDQAGWYYSGYFMNAQAYHFTALQTKGDAWSSTNSTGDDWSEYVEDGKLTMPFGIGGWYGPKITNTKANESYFYGGTWASGIFSSAPNGFENSGVYLGTYDAEQYYMPLAVYDPLECVDYVGHGKGEYGYGSKTHYGPSGSTIVDLGNVGGGLVVDHLQFRMISESGVPMGEGAEITVTIYDYVEGDEANAKVYTAELNASDFIMVGTAGSYGTEYCVNVYFSDVDEDGFETEIAPVLNNNVEIYIEDNQTNVDYGFLLNADDREDPDASNYPVVVSRSFWWDSEDQAYYRWRGCNATLDVMGYFNNLSTYGTPERSATGYVPNDAVYQTAEDGTKYTWAVAGIDEETGDAYNNFMVESTFDIEAFDVEFDSDVVLSCDFDTAYYAQYNAISFYVAVKELPQDVDSRTTTVTFISNGEVEYPITITQYGAGAGIKGINKDAEKEDNDVYTLQGVKVAKSEAELPAGVYVKNGKKFVK